MNKNSLLNLAKFGIVSLAFTLPQFINAAEVACSTVDAGFTTCRQFTASGIDQTFTVPANVTSIDIQAWGAGGGGSDFDYWRTNSGGGGGGFATGTLSVTPGQQLTIVVGSGGIASSTTMVATDNASRTYGGGGAGGASASQGPGGASGGGMSAVFLSGGNTAANVLLVAGGGGGASPGAEGNKTATGGGGGLTGGGDGNTNASGQGGTQTTGGLAAALFSACTSTPQSGLQFQGGNGAGSNEGGGGGGGGYFGGGGGACQVGANPEQNGPGGGGSSYVAGAGLTDGRTMAGGNGAMDLSGANGVAANTGSPQYVSGVAVGGLNTINMAGESNGGNGLVVIQFTQPKVAVSKTSSGGTGTFNFNLTGLDNTTDTVVTTAENTLVHSAQTNLSTNGSAVTVVEQAAANYATSFACIDANAATNGNSAASPIVGNGKSATIPATSIVPNADWTCKFTNSLANITLAKSAPSSVVAGGALAYGMSLGNSGTAASGTEITVADQLPAGVIASSVSAGTNVSAVNCGAMPSAAGALLRCTVTLTSPMAAGAANGAAAFSLQTTAPATGGSLTNYASSDPAGGAVPPTPGNACLPATSCGSATTLVTLPTTPVTPPTPGVSPMPVPLGDLKWPMTLLISLMACAYLRKRAMAQR